MNAKLVAGVITLSLIISLVAVTGCTETRKLTTDEDLSIAHECTGVKDYGNGVLYFDCNEEYFAYALSDHIGKFDVTVTAIAPAPTWSSSTFYKGYFVVVK